MQNEFISVIERLYLSRKKSYRRKRGPCMNINELSHNNLLSCVKTEEDINLFVCTINQLWSQIHTKETDDVVLNLPPQSLQLIWIVTTYLKQNVKPSEHTIDSMLKLLKTCIPEPKWYDQTTFDILIENANQEIIKERYEYFKYRVFGIHSNCYREIVQLCLDALQEMQSETIVEAFKKAKKKSIHQELQDIKEPFFGKLVQRTGQDYQVEQYEKYLTALHESSHAVAAYFLDLNFSGISIVTADNSSGCIQPKEWTKEEAHKKAICYYAGAVGEIAVLKPVFPTVWQNRSDVHEATKIIKKEVVQELSNPQEAMKYVFVDADVLGLMDKESPYIIYETVRRCVELRQQAFDLIASNKDMVVALAQELLEKQYLPSEEVIKFLDAYQNHHSLGTEKT